MNWDSVFAIGWKILAVIVLVGLNGFFVAAEFALVKVRDTQLDPLIAAGQRRARLARHLLQHLDAYLSATQVGITLASLGLGWIGEPIFADLLAPVFGWLHIESEPTRHAISFAVGFSIITFLHIVAGEMSPKSYAIRHPLNTVLWVAYPMQWFFYAAYPVIWSLNHSALWLLRQCGITTLDEHGGGHSEEELRLLLAAAPGRPETTKLGRDIVLNALDLRRRIVRQVMRPRQEITVLDTTAPMTDCLEVAEKSRYSRFPLCEDGDLDRTRGVVHIKDLFALRHKARTGSDLAVVARKLIYVPETARLERVLQLFLERKLHFAIVVDEYGGTTGMVTLENILEELVGQIQDEFDQEKPLLTATGPDSWDVAGNLPLHELEELVGEPLPPEGVTTVSGWVTHRLGGFPKAGDSVSLGHFHLRVEDMDGPRIERLALHRTARAGSESNPDAPRGQ